MIYGIGVDLVSTERMQIILQKYEDKFAKKILSNEEFNAWQERTNHTSSVEIKAAKLAKYWAAKEATSKAFGTGFAQGLSWRDIGLKYNNEGKPSLYFTGIAQHWANENNIAASHLSLSDEKTMVIAMVVLETT